MHRKDAAGIANSVDPDQTAPLGAVWSGSPLFAQACLSENLGTLRLCWVLTWTHSFDSKLENLEIDACSRQVYIALNKL